MGIKFTSETSPVHKFTFTILNISALCARPNSLRRPDFVEK
jgi:hypothetical protein